MTAKTKAVFTAVEAKEAMRATLKVLVSERRRLLDVARRLGDDPEGMTLESWLAGCCKESAAPSLQDAIKALRYDLARTEESIATERAKDEAQTAVNQRENAEREARADAAEEQRKAGRLRELDATTGSIRVKRSLLVSIAQWVETILPAYPRLEGAGAVKVARMLRSAARPAVITKPALEARP